MATAAFIYRQRPRQMYFSALHMHRHEQHTHKTVRPAGTDNRPGPVSAS